MLVALPPGGRGIVAQVGAHTLRATMQHDDQDTAPNSELAAEAMFYIVGVQGVLAVVASAFPDLYCLRLPEVNGATVPLSVQELDEAIEAGECVVASERYLAEAESVAEKAWQSWRAGGARAYGVDE